MPPGRALKRRAKCRIKDDEKAEPEGGVTQSAGYLDSRNALCYHTLIAISKSATLKNEYRIHLK
jgi:hypothetical protein